MRQLIYGFLYHLICVRICAIGYFAQTPKVIAGLIVSPVIRIN